MCVGVCVKPAMHINKANTHNSILIFKQW